MSTLNNKAPAFRHRGSWAGLGTVGADHFLRFVLGAINVSKCKDFGIGDGLGPKKVTTQ